MNENAVDKLRQLVRRLLNEKGAAVPFSDDESLFLSGSLDSVSAIEVIAYLETEFGVDFSKLDFDMSFIDSVSAMAKLVRQSRAM